MSVLDIRRAGDPVLKEKAKPVAKITKTVRSLLDNMVQTMQEADGVGLAAPQVGVSLRVIVVDVGEGLIELINPVIVASEGCETGTEGCLSIPGMYGDVERFTSVTVQGLDRQGANRLPCKVPACWPGRCNTKSTTWKASFLSNAPSPFFGSERNDPRSGRLHGNAGFCRSLS